MLVRWKLICLANDTAFVANDLGIDTSVSTKLHVRLVGTVE
jgi:hypothetical protein